MRHLRCPPPKGFVPAQDVSWVKLLPEQPAFIRRHRARGAKARGVSYERKVHDYLRECILGLPDWDYVQGPWIEFRDRSGKRWCQPDGFLLDTARRRCTLVEIKYRHTADAWWQLWRLYLPVIRVLLPEYSYACLEICKWFDPQTAFPEALALAPEPTALPSGEITAVHIWNPQRALARLANSTSRQQPCC